MAEIISGTVSKKTYKKLLMSIFAAALSFALLLGLLFAWFLPFINSNEFLTYIGDIDLECEVYVYKEVLTDGQELRFDGETRSQILSNHYLSISAAKERNTLLNADGSATFENIYIGKQLRYKIVIVNNSASESSASIDVSFANMTGYFKECVDIYRQGGSDDDLNEIFGNNSSRLLFNVKALTASLYTTADGNSNYDIPVDTAQPLLPDNSYLPLWRYSRGEAFGEKLADGIVVDSGNLLEIDFVLSCDFFTEEINSYHANALDIYKYLFVTSGQELDPEVEAAIAEIATQESLYIFGEEVSKLEFTIKGIVIRGTQLPG